MKSAIKIVVSTLFGLLVFVGSMRVGWGVGEILRPPEIVVDPMGATVTEAWQTALLLAHITEPWTPVTNIVRVPLSDDKFFGKYYAYHEMGLNGQVTLKEQIIVWVPLRQNNLLRNCLIHEFLHAIHNRLKLDQPVYRTIPNEVFVCAHGACPDDPYHDVIVAPVAVKAVP